MTTGGRMTTTHRGMLMIQIVETMLLLFIRMCHPATCSTGISISIAHKTH